MYKRLFAAMTALCLMLTLMPVSALAAEEELTTTTVTTVDGLKAAIDEGGDITLGNDITVEEALKIEAETVLNLNGFTLTLDMPDYNNYAIVVKADLTINGEGTVTVNAPFGIGTSTSFEGALTINGGAFVQTGDASYLFGAFGGHVEINGGTFSAPYCVLNCFDGYGATAEITGGTFVTGENGCSIMGNGITVADDVEIGDHWFDASIGGTYYWTLADAVEAAKDEDMITVLQDIEITEALTINKAITIAADEAVTITSTATDLFTVTSGELTLCENITIESNTSVLYANGGNIVIDGAMINVTNAEYAAAYADNGTITVENGSINQTGTNKVTLVAEANGKIVVNGGEVTSASSSALAVKNGGTATIAGGTVQTTSPDLFSAAFANGGTITVTGGIIKNVNGAALIATTNGSIEVTGGEIDSVLAHNENATMTISGGTFAEKPADAYIVEGKIAAQDGDVYVVRTPIASELTTDIGEIEFVIGVPTEFTFTTTANDDKDTMVIGTSNFSDAEAIEKLEYYEVQNDTWIELTGDFGPAAGFPMADATSKFRVTFKTAGDYSFTASMKHAETEAIVCSTVVEFTVTDLSAEAPTESAPVTESYDVAIADSANGSVAANTMRAGETSRVTLTVKADAGYVLESLTVTDKNGKEIKVTEKDGKYQFRMPASDVTVKAVFAAEADIEDETFTDVAEDAYYHDAVLWAVENGITNGMTESTFAPNATCTRAQMVTFLWRAAGCPVLQNAAHSFTDLDKDAYYYNAVLWAVEKDITNGVSLDAFDPNGTVTRGQAMTFLWRMDGKTAADPDHTFTDVEDGAYYEDAVAWGADEAITNGTSATTFSPDDACIRGQIVTFLYNYLVK